MLFPKRIKYRRVMGGRTKGIATAGFEFNFGEFGLKSLEPGHITDRQIEASRVAIVRALKKGGKLWLKIFPDKPVSRKPAETRMGGGKGGPEFWVATVKPGRMIFEIGGVTEDVAREALENASFKLPVKTKFVRRAG
jgi:large subunit ribosomal protein L16